MASCAFILWKTCNKSHEKANSTGILFQNELLQSRPHVATQIHRECDTCHILSLHSQPLSE